MEEAREPAPSKEEPQQALSNKLPTSYSPIRGPYSPYSNSSAFKALLELETDSNSILSGDPYLSTLSDHLSTLKTMVESFQKSLSKHALRSFLNRRVSSHEISRVAGSIGSEILAWIDRENVENLLETLNRQPPLSSSDEQVPLHALARFIIRDRCLPEL